MAEPITLRYDLAKFSADVQRFVQEHVREADRIVFEVGNEVLTDIREGWPVNRARDVRPNANVEPGVSRAAWYGPERVQPAWYRLTNPLPYARVIEYGGYPGVGPLTQEVAGFTLPGGIRVEAGIFPTQVPAAPVRYALSKNRNEIPQRLERSHQRLWGR